MRIVQTFWTAGQDPLKHTFGWLHPEHNLKSWALSCLSLREHYDEVALYTDSEGKRILIDKLHLPYTEVNVVFDDFPCLPQHWALAKIKTYSLQTKPFLHVDGDVYLPLPLAKDVLEAPLIAQNKEVGTDYYKDMMQRVLHNPNISLPECVLVGLKEESLASFNMGIFGGNDIDFIHRYCQEAFHFLESNSMNNPINPNSFVECNIFFEQIILAAMVEREHIGVGCLVGHEMYDQGYTVGEFCNLEMFRQRPIHHLLGGHKRNKHVLRMLKQYMLRNYPEYYMRIISLFPNPLNIYGESYSCLYEDETIRKYENTLLEKLREWTSIDQNFLLQQEKDIAFNIFFLSSSDKERKNFLLEPAPYIYQYSLPQPLSSATNQFLHERLKCEKNFPLRFMAIIPTLTDIGYQEEPILDVDKEILSVLSKGSMKQDDLVSYMCSFNEGPCQRNYVQKEIEYLVKLGIVIAKQDKNNKTIHY